jgi:hypothetical protein
MRKCAAINKMAGMRNSVREDSIAMRPLPRVRQVPQRQRGSQQLTIETETETPEAEIEISANMQTFIVSKKGAKHDANFMEASLDGLAPCFGHMPMMTS